MINLRDPSDLMLILAIALFIAAGVNTLIDFLERRRPHPRNPYAGLIRDRWQNFRGKHK